MSGQTLAEKDLTQVELSELTVEELQRAKRYFSSQIIKVSSLKRDRTHYDEGLQYAIRRYRDILAELRSRGRAGSHR